MPQYSAPLVGVNLSDVDWRDFGLGEAGVVADFNGSSYQLSLPTDSDVARIGSPTQRSVAHVANFKHVIPMGETEPLTIPAASASDRTDLIVLRYDPNYSGQPGPVRLARIPGSPTGVTWDDAPPGIEELPLWAITRKPGQALSQATVNRIYQRLAPNIEITDNMSLPGSSPLGSIIRQGKRTYERVLDRNGIPVWSQTNAMMAPRRYAWGGVPYSWLLNNGSWNKAPGSEGRFEAIEGHLYQITSKFAVNPVDGNAYIPWRFSTQAGPAIVNNSRYGTILEEWDGVTHATTSAVTMTCYYYATVGGSVYIAGMFAVAGATRIAHSFTSPTTTIVDLGDMPPLDNTRGNVAGSGG